MNIHEGRVMLTQIILVYLFIHRITSSLGSAILGVCFWCFSKLTWTWSIIAEVFGMNNLFTAVLLYLITCFQDAEESQKTKVCYTGLQIRGGKGYFSIDFFEFSIEN